ncbi:MAG: hypothetical protein C4291_15635 [Candidatus Dadabacteria bacterium]
MCEDDAWFFNNGFADELISLEKQLGLEPRDRMSILCIHDLHRTPRQYLPDIITSHDYVITDEPVLVFRKSKGG